MKPGFLEKIRMKLFLDFIFSSRNLTYAFLLLCPVMGLGIFIALRMIRIIWNKFVNMIETKKDNV